MQAINYHILANVGYLFLATWPLHTHQHDKLRGKMYLLFYNYYDNL